MRRAEPADDDLLREASDAELARRIGDGSRGAETELCRRFAPRIRLYGLRHLRDEEKARDLVQAVLLAVLEALRARRVDDVDRIDRFMLGTCRNVATRVRATERRMIPSELTGHDVPVLPLEPLGLDLTKLFGCLEHLDVRAHAIVLASFAREKSSEEIARALETTPGNVRVARHRALAQLRDCIERPRGAAP